METIMAGFKDVYNGLVARDLAAYERKGKATRLRELEGFVRKIMRLEIEQAGGEGALESGCLDMVEAFDLWLAQQDTDGFVGFNAFKEHPRCQKALEVFRDPATLAAHWEAYADFRDSVWAEITVQYRDWLEEQE